MATRRATGVYFRQRTTNARRQPVSGPRVIQTASYLPVGRRRTDYPSLHPTKSTKDFNKLETETEGWKADVIYFDAFAPEKQPEMWSQELFNRLYVLLNNGGILTTYCAKGVVRRMLQAAGFIVERLPALREENGKYRARKQE